MVVGRAVAVPGKSRRVACRTPTESKAENGPGTHTMEPNRTRASLPQETSRVLGSSRTYAPARMKLAECFVLEVADPTAIFGDDMAVSAELVLISR
jgi:hypothetical protein